MVDACIKFITRKKVKKGLIIKNAEYELEQMMKDPLYVYDGVPLKNKLSKDNLNQGYRTPRFNTVMLLSISKLSIEHRGIF